MLSVISGHLRISVLTLFFAFLDTSITVENEDGSIKEVIAVHDCPMTQAEASFFCMNEYGDDYGGYGGLWIPNTSDEADFVDSEFAGYDWYSDPCDYFVCEVKKSKPVEDPCECEYQGKVYQCGQDIIFAPHLCEYGHCAVHGVIE